MVISYEVKATSDGQSYKQITDVKAFGSYQEAQAYVARQKSDNFRIISDNPYVSPVPLPALERYKLVYSSKGSTMMPSGGLISQVKIFEHIRD
jgi:hypothetical protein